MMEELLAALGIEVLHKPQKQNITELCSYTKTTERKVEIKVDLQSLCKEKNIDYKDVDKTVFVEEFTLEVELKKFNGELFFQTSLPLQDKKKIHFGSVVQRLDKPDAAKAAGLGARFLKKMKFLKPNQTVKHPALNQENPNYSLINSI
jgi:hypothetical protein